jgi:hypothetical protein
VRDLPHRSILLLRAVNRKVTESDQRRQEIRSCRDDLLISRVTEEWGVRAMDHSAIGGGEEFPTIWIIEPDPRSRGV